LNPAASPAPLRLGSCSILRGCNIYHGDTVIRQTVDFGLLRGQSSREAGPDFAGRFLNRFFDTARTVPNGRMNKHFLNRLHSREGAPFEEVLLEAILHVESSLAFAMCDFRPIGMARVLNGTAPRIAVLVWETRAPRFSRDAARVALAGLTELLPESLYQHVHAGSGTFREAFDALEKRARQRQRSTTTSVIELAAHLRGIPCGSLGGPHLLLGHGAAQRMIYASVPGNTPLAAARLSRNKRRTASHLAGLSLPVPKQIKVATVEESLAAADSLGFPVVVKPLKGKQASGVSVGVSTPDEMRAAFGRAQHGTDRVIVESFVPGSAYRLLVMGGRFVAALRIEPSAVTGNGKSSIRTLVDALNGDPLRNGIRLFKVEFDDEMIASLRQRGYALDDVPGAGVEIPLRSAANVAVGGVHTDVTDIVHPDNREMAVRAAQGMGLDVAGIDFITRDIGQSFSTVGGCIIEVNARPGLCMHTFPRHGKSRNVAGALLELSFPRGVSGRILTAVIIGDRKTAGVSRVLDEVLRKSGTMTGRVTKKGAINIGGKSQPHSSSKKRDAVKSLLRDPRVEALILARSPLQAVRRGLVLDRADVAAIMHPARGSDPDVYREALKVAVSAASRVIVTTGNSVALEALKSLDPGRLILVSRRSRDPAIDSHLAAGGAVVTRIRKQEQNWIVVRRNNESLATISAAAPDAGGDDEAARLDVRMFAIALAFGLGKAERGMNGA
jgi:cyanophycin synthetase